MSTNHLCMFFKVYSFFQRQRQSTSRGGDRERETQNPKQALVSELSAQSPTQGSNSWTMRSWPEPKSDAQPTEPPRRPSFYLFNEATSTFKFAHMACIFLTALQEGEICVVGAVCTKGYQGKQPWLLKARDLTRKCATQTMHREGEKKPLKSGVESCNYTVTLYPKRERFCLPLLIGIYGQPDILLHHSWAQDVWKNDRHQDRVTRKGSGAPGIHPLEGLFPNQTWSH